MAQGETNVRPGGTAKRDLIQTVFSMTAPKQHDSDSYPASSPRDAHTSTAATPDRWYRRYGYALQQRTSALASIPPGRHQHTEERQLRVLEATPPIEKTMFQRSTPPLKQGLDPARHAA